MVRAPVARQDLGGSSRAGTQCQPRLPRCSPNVPVGCSQRALAAGKTALGQTRHPATLNVSPQSWEMRASPEGCGMTQGREQEGDRQQERAGRTALPALHSSCLNPCPRRGEERVCRHPLPSLQTLPCPLFVCLSLRSCCCITSHIFQPAEQGWELLSIARLSSSATGQGHPRHLLPCQSANLHVRNSPFWGKCLE